jgi:hypothetical protein
MHSFMGLGRRQWSVAALTAAGWVVLGTLSAAQVFVVDREHVPGVPAFQPTNVELKQQPLTARGHQELISAFASEQGFARRPLPLGAHGLVLHANGALSPDGSDYAQALEKNGISAKAGDRVVITDLRIEPKRIVFDFNGGPEKKHRYLRHISVGAGAAEVPLARDDGSTPVGSRLTLVFADRVPEMTPEQVKALIRPVLDFDVKTPVEAYTETLPPKIKNAILQHQVLVGMDRKMVTYALGQPERKVREQEGGAPFEEWIYGDAPKPIQFVRFVNNRVTRVEVANFGEALVIRDKDETDGYLGNPNTRDVQMGDRQVNPSGEVARKQAPSLRLPGEDLPQSPMQPVKMPKDSAPQPQAQPTASGQPATPTQSQGQDQSTAPPGSHDQFAHYAVASGPAKELR